MLGVFLMVFNERRIDYMGLFGRSAIVRKE